MILTIDIGNTNSVIGFFAEKKLINSIRISTKTDITTDELKIKFLNIFKYLEIEQKNIQSVIIASVVPNLSYIYRELLDSLFNFKSVFISDVLEKLPIKISLNNINEIGEDRIANAASVIPHKRDNIIIIDFGTAITFDIITKEGGYDGGIIFPGVNLALDYLGNATAKLPKIDLKETDKIVGKSTIEAIQSGIFHGYLSLIEGMVDRIEKDYDKTFHIIATGGSGKLFSEYSKLISEYNPNLTLEGLVIISSNLKK